MVLVRQRLVMLRRLEQLQRISIESSDLRTLLSTSLAQRSRQTYLLLATRLMLLLSQRVRDTQAVLRDTALSQVLQDMVQSITDMQVQTVLQLLQVEYSRARRCLDIWVA